MIILILFAYKFHWKKMALLGILFIFSFVFFNNFQAIGSKKYYGQDYMILNTTNVLYNIFNDPQAKLSYEGAEEDLANIEAVVPVQVLKESGMAGYRNFNWTSGRRDFNQTLSDDVTAHRYMSAYYRLIIHNILDYLNLQVNCLFSALQIDASHATYSYTGDSYSELQPFVYDVWQIGSDDIRETFLMEAWGNNEFRIFVYSVLSWIMYVWREFWENSGINAMLHSVAIIADVLILVFEMIKMFADKQKYHLKFIFLNFILIGELAVILLFMPEGRAAYLYPMLYSSYLLIYLYIIFGVRKNHIINEETSS